ncbi:helix-turn-helix domain-containing protein [Eikenella sp. S3360]|uniref:Helix-turn-helix domain-containing protein n=1 Tax=Eikenella glucosivorans TaxID=2766967 RepID=A0ABS0N743_9NEIS|nr:helix-turn-helix domain-containing protein [Eikenella glucosivorans]MBH5328090.1 helix-turn-helix domain-containing protein [Eikenella glucosivorans]
MQPTHRRAPKTALYAQSGMNDFVFNIPFSVFQVAHQGKPLFDLQICADDGQNVATALGANIPVHGGLDLMDKADIIVIAGWRDIAAAPSAALTAHLHKAAARGAQITALCYGTYALAYAGLLDGKTAATHWLAESDFVRRFPRVSLDTNRLYVEDGGFLTSAGAAGGLDCCLYLIRKIHGATAANDIARTLVAAPHREGGQAQFTRRPAERRTSDDKINRLLDELRQNLAAPHRLDDLAARLAVSRRTFIRHFSRATGMNFGEWLTAERLWQVQDWLENTDWPVERIAEQSGFGSAANLRAQFKAKFQTSPNAWRKVFGK